MKLSKKSDYALRALFTLVEYRGRGPLSIREIAERNDIPQVSGADYAGSEVTGLGFQHTRS